MSEETPDAMRARLLKQLMEVPLPARVGLDGATPSEIAMFKSLFRDGLIIGDCLPNPQNTGIAVMTFTDFSADAHRLVAERAPTARAKSATKEVLLWVVGVVASGSFIFGALTYFFPWSPPPQPATSAPSPFPAAAQLSTATPRPTTPKPTPTQAAVTRSETTISSAQSVAESQRQATTKYPALAQEGTPLHTRFLAIYNDAKRNERALLSDPNWPMILADRAVQPRATAEQLMQQADAALRTGEFSAAADAFSRIVAGYPSTPESKTVLTLRDFVRAEQKVRDGPFLPNEAQKIRSSMDAFDRIRAGYLTTTPDKRRALEVIFGPDAFRDGSDSLESFARSSANFRSSLDKANQGL